MRGSKKITVMSSEEMRAACARGEDQSDWERVRREQDKDPLLVEQNRAIGALIAKIEARKRGGRRRGSPALDRVVASKK